MGDKVASRQPMTIQVVRSPAGNPSSAVTGGSVKQPQAPVPMRRQLFHAKALANASDIARQLNILQDKVHEATLPSRSNPRNQSVTFEGLRFSPGNIVFVHHSLGTKVRWSIVRWYNTTTAPSIIEPGNNSQSDPNVLQLAGLAGITGTADVEVWSAV